MSEVKRLGSWISQMCRWYSRALEQMRKPLLFILYQTNTNRCHDPCVQMTCKTLPRISQMWGRHSISQSRTFWKDTSSTFYNVLGHQSHVLERSRTLSAVNGGTRNAIHDQGGHRSQGVPWISQMWHWHARRPQSRTFWKDTSPSSMIHPTCSRERIRVRVLSSALRHCPTVAPYALPGSKTLPEAD